MKTGNTASFSDNIRHMFLRHAIIPVIGIALFCLAAFIFTWSFILISVNINSNKSVGNEFEATLTAYSSLAEQLTSDSELVQNASLSVNKAQIHALVYDTANKTGKKAEIFIYDSLYNTILASANTVSDYLNGELYSDWAVFGQMQEHPNATILRVISSAENGPLMCIGRAVTNNTELRGYLVFAVEADEFSVLLSEVAGQTIIADSKGWIYTSNNYALLDNLGRLDRNLDSTQGFINYNGKYYYITNKCYHNNSIKVCTVSELDQELPLLLVLFGIIVIIFTALIITTYLSSGRLAEKSTKDINTIADAFDKVMQGNLDTKLDIHGSREFEKIGEAYNMMLQSLKEQIKHNREMVQHVANAQIKQLESQFNPHFLYNTLDNIRYVCLVDPNEAEKMIVSLSSLLRYSINSNEEETTVAEDMRFTQNYLHILTVRFHQRFTYELNIDEAIYQTVIPKLMLQPLIENAVKYGFDDKEVLNVAIRGYALDGKLVFTCSDNGSGISVPELNTLRKSINLRENTSGHSGLYNINRRIKLRFGPTEEYGVTVDSEKGSGTTITITLPERYPTTCF